METMEKRNLVKLNEYLALIKEYLTEQISVLDFEQKYFEMFKQDETLWTEKEFTVLNDLFSDVDAFCYDSAIRSSEDLDEHQLRNRAEITLKNLKELII